MNRSKRIGMAAAAGAVALLATYAHRTQSPAFFALWLAAWWCAAGVVMGALLSLWLHTLTGGEWGESLHSALLRIGSAMPLLSLAALPLALGLQALYPWARGDDWAKGLSSPSFKLAWLAPHAVLLRGALCLALWTGLAVLTRRPQLQRSRGFAAFALIAYAFSASLAAVDWLMSLTPRWYAAGFGLVVLVGQGLAGLAAAVALRRGPASKDLLRDLGNLLMAWLLMWAYLAFVQFQIIWAENLPHEITWYLPRVAGPWRPLAWMLLLGGFALPLTLLLFRGFKEDPRRLRGLALGLLLMHAANTAWLVLPSVQPPPARVEATGSVGTHG